MAFAARQALQEGHAVLWFDRRHHALEPDRAALAIGNALTVVAAPPIIFIDDADDVDRHAVVAMLEHIAASQNQVRVVLGARSPGALPIARLRAAGAIDLVGADHLHFAPTEARSWIERHVARRWQDPVAALAGRWPVALNMLARWTMAAGASAEPSDGPEMMRNSGLDALIAEEIVPHLSARHRRTLLLASLFDRPGRQTLARVAPGEELDRALQELPGLLDGLVSAAETGFVLHPALRSYFERQFDLLDRDERALIYAAAAESCADEGALAAAARLARRAGLPERIDAFVERYGPLRIWVVMGYSIVRDLISQAGSDMIKRSPRLRMMQCIVYMKDGRISEAQALLRDALKDVGDDAELRDDAEILRATQLVYGCELETSSDLGAFERIVIDREGDPAWQTLLSTLSCILHSQRARFDSARANLIDARSHARAVGSTYNLLFLDLHLTVIELAQGNLRAARNAMVRARQRWRTEFIADIGVETVINALNAQIEFESGQLTSARRSLRRSAHRMPESEAWFDIYAAAYEPMARILAADHGVGAAIEALADNGRKLTTQGLGRVAALLGGYADCLWGEAWLRGAIPADKHEWQRSNLAATATWQEYEVFTLATAYRALVKGDPGKAAASMIAALEYARGRLLHRSELRFLLLLFTALDRAGRRREAKSALIAAVRLGAPAGMRQVFREIGGPALMAQLSRLREADDLFDEVERRFVGAVLGGAGRLARGQSVASLTEREREVLIVLANGGSDKILARQLGISEHGVRFHLKNVFQKMEVHDRVAAVAKARAEGVVV